MRKPRHMSAYRKAMWKWINGPGLNFRDPLPNSTNYLGGYDMRTGTPLAVQRKRRDGLTGFMSAPSAFAKAVDRANADTERREQQVVAAAADHGGGERSDDDIASSGSGEFSERGQVSDAGDPVDAPSRRNVKQDDGGDTGPLSTVGAGSAVAKFPRGYDTTQHPFPLNAYFRAQPVLSEEFREKVYERVVLEGQSVRAVSAAMGVSMERVGAVVRLVEVEKGWVKEGKPLAKLYARAVMSMLPQTPYEVHRTTAFSATPPTSTSSSNEPPPPPSPTSQTTAPVGPAHEPINDLPVHAATRQQLFHPAPESQQFTRVEAARVFNPKLLPADARIPHAELIGLERDRLNGVQREEREHRLRERSAQLDENARRRVRFEAAGGGRPVINNLINPNVPVQAPGYSGPRRTTSAISGGKPGGLTVVSGRRWDFMIQDVAIDTDVGEKGGKGIARWKLKNGRGGHVGGKNKAVVGERSDARVVGWRYGVPHQDRKKGVVRIPTYVD